MTSAARSSVAEAHGLHWMPAHDLFVFASMQGQRQPLDRLDEQQPFDAPIDPPEAWFDIFWMVAMWACGGGHENTRGSSM